MKIHNVTNELGHDDPMPFGKYQGEAMADVPENHLRWLYDDGLDEGPVLRYIEKHVL